MVAHISELHFHRALLRLSDVSCKAAAHTSTDMGTGMYSSSSFDWMMLHFVHVGVALCSQLRSAAPFWFSSWFWSRSTILMLPNSRACRMAVRGSPTATVWVLILLAGRLHCPVSAWARACNRSTTGCSGSAWSSAWALASPTLATSVSSLRCHIFKSPQKNIQAPTLWLYSCIASIYLSIEILLLDSTVHEVTTSLFGLQN